jgi:hypothetical protein
VSERDADGVGNIRHITKGVLVMASIRRIVVATALAGATVVLAGPAPASANQAAGADFGQHVRICAQAMGFTGEHNPGMHQGYAGWDGMSCEMHG